MRFCISIHAPQWGATSGPSQILPSKPFQSTHPSGVRLPGAAHVVIDGTISIHAPQWGATGPAKPSRCPCCYFNPRTPVGCDLDILRVLRIIGISIHAPQWGATTRMGIAFHNMEAPSVLKTDFIAKIHVHRSIHKFSNQKHQQTIHF